MVNATRTSNQRSAEFDIEGEIRMGVTTCFSPFLSTYPPTHLSLFLSLQAARLSNPGPKNERQERPEKEQRLVGSRTVQ